MKLKKLLNVMVMSQPLKIISVNRQKTYQARCERLNTLVNWLVDVYSDYS